MDKAHRTSELDDEQVKETTDERSGRIEMVVLLWFVIAGSYFFWYLIRIIVGVVPEDQLADTWGWLGVSGFLMIIGFLLCVAAALSTNAEKRKRSE